MPLALPSLPLRMGVLSELFRFALLPRLDSQNVLVWCLVKADSPSYSRVFHSPKKTQTQTISNLSLPLATIPFPFIYFFLWGDRSTTSVTQ